MKKTAEIEVRVSGTQGNVGLSKANYDIKHIIRLLQDVENMLFGENKKSRPIISYDIKNGSVRHIFRTSAQTVIGFNAILAQIKEEGSLDFLQIKTAQAIENMQRTARQNQYEFQIKTSLKNSATLSITPDTKFYRKESSWAEAEFYFYGTLKDAGGKNRANIHLDTEDYGYITIETDQKFLQKLKENPLYKELGVRVKGRQDTETGEIDPKSLKLINLVDYQPKFDRSYLDELIAKAKKSWKDIDTDKWLAEIRGSYEE